MRKLKYFILSLKNVIKRPKSSIKILIAFTAMTVLAEAYLFYNSNLNNNIQQLLNQSLSTNYITIKESISSHPVSIDYTPLVNEEGVSEICHFGYFPHLTHGSDKIKIDGTTYTYYTEGFGYLIDYALNDFPINITKEFQSKTGLKSLIEYGRFIHNDYEFMVTKNQIASWGYDSPESLIGSTFTFYDYNGSAIARNYTLVGIINDSIFDLSEFKSAPEDNFFVFPMTWAQNNLRTVSITYKLNIYISDYSEVERLLQLAEGICVNQVATYNDYAYRKLALLKNQQTLINKVFLVTAFVLFITIISNIILNILFEVDKKHSYYGMLLSEGMRKGDLILISIVELMVVYTVASLLGLIVSYSLISIFNTYFKDLVNMTFETSALDYLKVFLEIFGLGLIINIFISSITMRGVTRKTPAEILKL